MNELLAAYLALKRRKLIAWLIKRGGFTPATAADLVDDLIEAIEESHF